MYMLAFVKISMNDGISKKILAQASALSVNNGECTLLCISDDDHFQMVRYTKGSFVKIYKKEKLNIDYHSLKRVDPFIESCKREMKKNNQPLYIRHMIPSKRFLRFLSEQAVSKIFYEIPTYPYFYEQYSVSNNKVKTLLRIAYECLYWPFIYSKIYKLIVIPCRSNVKKFKKMEFITNGYTQEEFSEYNEKKDNANLVMVGVGTIQRYHGYDKIIDQISKYEEKNKLRFYIVGGGEVEYLKKLVKEKELEDVVVFTGPKRGEELKSIYRIAHIGIGTLALEFRKADIDTGIKILDYYTHGLPVLSSGDCPLIKGYELVPYYKYKEEFDFSSLIEWLTKFTDKNRQEMIEKAKKNFSWDTIMGGVFSAEKM